MDSNAPRAHRQQALAAYVEPLAIGRRVLVLGDSSLGLGARIAELGAQSVQLWDPDAERARRQADRAPRGVIVRPVPGRGQGAADEVGAFDLAVIADLELFDDAPDIVARVRTLVGDEGAALVCTPNREGDDAAAYGYYELFDLVASQFDGVTMIAQLPFQGVALAELADDGEGESPPVTVDTQLAGPSRPPEAFVALASQRGLRLDPYAIVELPQTPSADEDAREAETMRLAVAEAALRAVRLEDEAGELRARLADANLALRAATRLEAALRECSARVVELENALAARSSDVLELSQELPRVRLAGDAQRETAAQLEALLVRAERAEGALAAAGPDQECASDLHAAELARYEEVLRDRAQTMRALQAELARRDRMIRELVDAMAEPRPAPPAPGVEVEREPGREGFGEPRPAPPVSRGGAETEPVGDGFSDDAGPSSSMPPSWQLAEQGAQLRQKLDALALELARREGEAQASAWTIAELQRRLDSESPAAAPASNGPAKDANAEAEIQARLAAALDELNVLRRALAQEHEARLRAESAQAPLHKPAQD